MSYVDEVLARVQKQNADQHEPDQGPVAPKLIGELICDPLGTAGPSAPTVGLGGLLLAHGIGLL